MYDTILVAIDGSDAANRAGEHARDVAETFDAHLHAVYVVDTGRYGSSMIDGSSGVLDELEDRGAEILDAFAEGIDADLTTEIRHGRPHGEIDAYADEIDADLVVLGNRGMGQTPGGEIGSVAERVVRNVGRPVITA